MGHPRQPRRAQGHRPAAVDQGLDGEADARRPRQARRHPHRRGQQQSAILTAEGKKQSAILNAEGDRESLILRAQANRESAILRAQGEAQAITNVFQAIHDGQPDQSLLAYQYLQMLPKIAEGDANKVWVIPSEITKALEGLGSAVHEVAGIPLKSEGVRHRVADYGSTDRLEQLAADRELASTNKAVEAAIAAAEHAAHPGHNAEATPHGAPRRPLGRRTRRAPAEEPPARAHRMR